MGEKAAVNKEEEDDTSSVLTPEELVRAASAGTNVVVADLEAPDYKNSEQASDKQHNIYELQKRKEDAAAPAPPALTRGANVIRNERPGAYRAGSPNATNNDTSSRRGSSSMFHGDDEETSKPFVALEAVRVDEDAEAPKNVLVSAEPITQKQYSRNWVCLGLGVGLLVTLILMVVVGVIVAFVVQSNAGDHSDLTAEQKKFAALLNAESITHHAVLVGLDIPADCDFAMLPETPQQRALAVQISCDQPNAILVVSGPNRNFDADECLVLSASRQRCFVVPDENDNAYFTFSCGSIGTMDDAMGEDMASVEVEDTNTICMDESPMINPNLEMSIENAGRRDLQDRDNFYWSVVAMGRLCLGDDDKSDTTTTTVQFAPTTTTCPQGEWNNDLAWPFCHSGTSDCKDVDGVSCQANIPSLKAQDSNNQDCLARGKDVPFEEQLLLVNERNQVETTMLTLLDLQKEAILDELFEDLFPTSR